jgi:hypothetical protein
VWRSALSLGLLAGLSVAAGAQASGVAEPGSTAGPDSLSVTPRSGLSHGGRLYVLEGRRTTVQVEIERPVAGERVSVEVDGNKHALPGTPIPANAGGGPLSASFTPRRSGVHRIVVEREGGGTASATVHAVDPRPRPGSKGIGVTLLQEGLNELGYVTSRGGRYDSATARAVIAYRKANGMARRPTAGRALLAPLFDGKGGYRVRYPRAGRHVEFDWSRQVLVLARGRKVERVYHASSGKASTPTVFGTFRFYRKQPGTNARGMVQSNYFIRGYAIHGYKSVPVRPASHGCIRVPVADARSIDAWINLGDRIFVYR